MGGTTAHAHLRPTLGIGSIRREESNEGLMCFLDILFLYFCVIAAANFYLVLCTSIELTELHKQQHVTTVFQVAVRNKNTLVVFSDPPRDTYHGLKYAQCRALFQQDYKDSLLKTNQDVLCGPLLRDEQNECLVSTSKYGSVPRFIKTIGPGCPLGKVVNSWLQPNSRKLRSKALNGVLIRRKSERPEEECGQSKCT